MLFQVVQYDAFRALRCSGDLADDPRCLTGCAQVGRTDSTCS